MNEASDRAFVMTPPGVGAIAVVRIVGPRVGQFLRAHFDRPAVESRCVHGDLSSADGVVIDDPVVVLLPGGRAADVSLHGGPWVVRSVWELLRKEGFEVSQPAAGDEPVPLDAVDGATVLEREVNAHLPL